jgi:M3 family oligoendopeptidase
MPVNPVTIEQAVDFEEIQEQAPALDQVAAEHKRLHAAWQAAADATQRVEVFERWDALRRRLWSWQALTRLRFDQDTRDAHRKAAREQLDELAPKLTALDTEMKQMLLASPHREDLEQRLGRHVFALWEADVATFTPAIEPDLTQEAQLEAQYTELTASARLEIEGATVNLTGIEPYLQRPDRDLRHRAQVVRSEFFARNADEFDRIYDELVRMRHAMARKLGFENFIGLGYKRMNRVDFDQQDVERYRDQVVRSIVPLAHDIVRRRAHAQGLAEATFWDEEMSSAAGNPAPHGDHDWIVDRGAEVMAEIHPVLGKFYDMMIQRRLVDLKNRDGKAGGGYCTAFPSYGVPFIFASFNGTHFDAHVLVHEVGHAFQDWQSRMLPACDYLSPTSESAEVHSMSLEYLAAPFMERFFGADAERYRRQQLEEAMLFLPYGVAIDHFQHLVYATPEATPAQRNLMWQQMEARYLPWRRYGDLAYWAQGAYWQAKQHVYHAPFYYIDYTLALCCALQFWVRSREDYGRAVADYVALCGRGGEAAFGDLIRSAGLSSPFEEGSLARVAAEARAVLVS